MGSSESKPVEKKSVLQQVSAEMQFEELMQVNTQFCSLGAISSRTKF